MYQRNNIDNKSRNCKNNRFVGRSTQSTQSSSSSVSISTPTQRQLTLHHIKEMQLIVRCAFIDRLTKVLNFPLWQCILLAKQTPANTAVKSRHKMKLHWEDLCNNETLSLLQAPDTYKNVNIHPNFNFINNPILIRLVSN